MNDEDDEEQLFQTVKTNFLKTLQSAHKERTKQIIEGAVQKVHEITIHAQMLLKLFFLWKYENNEELPFLDITYLRLVFKSVCLRHGRDPSKILIGVGDWSGRNIVKFQRPYLKSKTFCKMFQRAGFPVVLVDEFRTSKRCCACRGVTETFRDFNCLFIYLFIFLRIFCCF